LGVPLLFGPEWGPAVVPTQVLAIASIPRVVLTVNSDVVLAHGKAHWAFRWGILTTTVLIAGFIIGLRWGINGVAWSYLLAGLPLTIGSLVMTSRLIPFGVRGYAAAIGPSVSVGIAMTAVWIVVERTLGSSTGDLLVLLVATASAVAGGLLIMVAFWRNVARRQVEFGHLMVARRRTDGSPPDWLPDV
jgi:PST family polysaccharide transporter